MAQYLSRWMTEAYADRLMVAVYASLTAVVVFLFLRMQLAGQ